LAVGEVYEIKPTDNGYIVHVHSFSRAQIKICKDLDEVIKLLKELEGK